MSSHSILVLLLDHLVLVAELSQLGSQLFNVLFFGLDLVLDDGVQVLDISGRDAARRGHRALFLGLLDLLKHFLSLL